MKPLVDVFRIGGRIKQKNKKPECSHTHMLRMSSFFFVFFLFFYLFLFFFFFFFFFFNISFSDEMRFYSVYTVLEYIAIG